MNLEKLWDYLANMMVPHKAAPFSPLGFNSSSLSLLSPPSSHAMKPQATLAGSTLFHAPTQPLPLCRCCRP